MGTYADHMKAHLARYRQEQLGVTEAGVWLRNGQAYPHILPSRLRALNILPDIRTEFWAHARAERIRLHKDFHHLTSSQAFAFNLFFPLIQAGESASTATLRALGLSCSAVETWHLEAVLDEEEGTNFDVCASTSAPRRSVCKPGIEVKLTEASFGPAKDDPRHRKKRDLIYRPRLLGKVHDDALKDEHFFRHYQIIRNLSYIDPEAGQHVVFLLPRANKSLTAALDRFLNRFLLAEVTASVRVAYAEDVVANLRQAPELSAQVRAHYNALATKYDLAPRTAATNASPCTEALGAQERSTEAP